VNEKLMLGVIVELSVRNQINEAEPRPETYFLLKRRFTDAAASPKQYCCDAGRDNNQS
jgi:hypothetical protein